MRFNVLVLLIFVGCIGTKKVPLGDTPKDVSVQESLIEIRQIPAPSEMKFSDYEGRVSFLPEITPRFLQENVEPRFWPWIRSYLIKGKTFIVKSSFKIEESVEQLQVYDTKDFSKKSPFEISANGLYYNKELVCNLDEHNLTLEFLKYPTKQICPFSIPYAVNEEELLFNFTDYDLEKGWLEVPIDNKKHYVDIGFCKKTPQLCRIENKLFNDIEIRWGKLIQKRNSRDIGLLNYYMDNLKPCLKTPDLNCINKYVLNKEIAGKLSEDGAVPYRDISFEKKVEELKECLDEKKLLLHMRASKGIDYICVFGQGFVSIVFPTDLDSESFDRCERDYKECLHVYPVE